MIELDICFEKTFRHRFLACPTNVGQKNYLVIIPESTCCLWACFALPSIVLIYVTSIQGNLGFLIYNSIWCVSEGEGKLFCAAYTLYFCVQLGGPGCLTYRCQAAHKVLDGQGDANGDHAVHGPHLTRSLRTLDLLAAASEVELCCKGSFDIGSSCQTTSWYRHELMNA